MELTAELADAASGLESTAGLAARPGMGSCA